MSEEQTNHVEQIKATPISDRKADLMANFDQILGSGGTKPAQEGDSNALQQEKEATQEAKADKVDSKSDSKISSDENPGKIASLLNKFQKKEANFLKEKDNLRKENESLRSQLAEITALKQKIEQLEKDPAGYITKRKDFGEIYEKATDFATGRQAPVTQDEIEKRIQSALEQERQARLKIEERLSSETREKAVREYQSTLQRIASGDGYELAREFYQDADTTLESEALTYAEVYASRFGQVIDAADAVAAVAKYAQKSVDIAKKLEEKKKPKEEIKEKPNKSKTLASTGKVDAPSAGQMPLSIEQRKARLLDEVRRGVFKG